MIAPREPLAVELLVSAHQRRLTVDDHAEFRARMAADLSERSETIVPHHAEFRGLESPVLTSGSSPEGANEANVQPRPFSAEASNPEPPQA